MVEAVAEPDVSALPLAPKNPLPHWHQLKAVRSFIDGVQKLADAGGPVSRIVLGPKWLFPSAVVITAPQGARDVLGRTDEIAEGRSRWQYLPFGGGPRSCVGDHFAMLEATLALATIVRNVKIHSMNDDFPLATPFTVAAAPIRARVHTRTPSTVNETEMRRTK